MGKIFDYDGVPVLHTTSGDLKGYFYDGVYIYKGIPYAYADRFQMPVPSKWNGVKDEQTMVLYARSRIRIHRTASLWFRTATGRRMSTASP